MSTFLTLVQDFYREMGYSGTVPSTVVSQSSQKRKAVDWIAKAEYQINTKWFDWNFLWTQWSRSTVAGTANYAAPSDIGTWDLESVYLDYTADSYQNLDYITYKEWRRDYRNGTKSNALSDSFTILPDKSITLEPPPDAVYSLSADYWKAPTRMTVDASQTPIPAQFERIIIVRAKFFHYDHFADGNIPPAVMGEYGDLMDKLEADQLPDRPDRLSEQQEMTITVE